MKLRDKMQIPTTGHFVEQVNIMKWLFYFSLKKAIKNSRKKLNLDKYFFQLINKQLGPHES